MTIFKLPDLGEGLAEAEIREWYVKEGDYVEIDQPLVSMETAKAVVDVPSPYAGTITSLHGKVNDVIPTGAPLLSFDEDKNSKETKSSQHSVVGSLEESLKKWDDAHVSVGSKTFHSAALKAMPAARILAKEMNIDLHSVNSSGPNGLITVGDVKKCFQTASSASVVLPENKEALHGVKRSMAHIMSQSHQEVVPVTILDDADITHLTEQADLSVCVLKAIVNACQKEPSLNAWFDGKNLERSLFQDVNIGLAIDTPHGLFVPVIKKVGNHSDQTLRENINQLKQMAKDRTLSPSDMQEASITLSNFGTMAGRYATPIIVPPMVAILGCGKKREAALVKEGKVYAGCILPLSLTFDHRAVTGGEAARFLSVIIETLQA